MCAFAYFRFKNVQSRVDQTMPKAMVAATHWFFFFNYCMKLICDAYTCIYTHIITRGVCWLWSPCLRVLMRTFFLLNMYISNMWIHPFFIDEFTDIGISLICRCIIIRNNHEIKQYLAFSVSKLNSIVIKLFKVLLVKESACKYMYCFLLKKNYLQNLNYYIDLNLYPYNFFVMK